MVHTSVNNFDLGVCNVNYHALNCMAEYTENIGTISSLEKPSFAFQYAFQARDGGALEWRQTLVISTVHMMERSYTRKFAYWNEELNAKLQGNDWSISRAKFGTPYFVFNAISITTKETGRATDTGMLHILAVSAASGLRMHFLRGIMETLIWIWHDIPVDYGGSIQFMKIPLAYLKSGYKFWAYIPLPLELRLSPK